MVVVVVVLMSVINIDSTREAMICIVLGAQDNRFILKIISSFLFQNRI